jgi:beta-lactamase regulating signal transducer with metallopeptidase domain
MQEISHTEWKEYKKTLYELRDNVNTIKEALCGNEFNNKGIIKRVECLEEKSKKTEKKGWIAAGVMAVLLILVKFGDKLLKLLQ